MVHIIICDFFSKIIHALLQKPREVAHRKNTFSRMVIISTISRNRLVQYAVDWK